MMDLETIAFVVAITGTVLVVFSSAPAVWDLIKRFSSRRKRSEINIHDNARTSNRSNRSRGRPDENGGYQLVSELYRDEDGEATEESMNSFSDRVYHILIALLAATGFLLSLALGIIVTKVSSIKSPVSTSWLIDQWLQFGIWVRISSPL
jgi:hypothetical protein